MSFKNYQKVGEKYGINSDTNWFKLQEGPNKLRLVSEFEDYGSHFDQKLNKTIICLGKDNCDYCKAGEKPRVQFKGWAINREDNTFKLLTIGYKVYQQIGEYANSEEYGFENIPGYDITINKSGTGLGTKYTVLPDRKDTSLTDGEIDNINQLAPVSDILEKMKNKVLENNNQSNQNEENAEEKELNEDELIS